MRKSRSGQVVYGYIAQKMRAILYLGGRCQSCGYSKCKDALEFHHRDPGEKEFSWKYMRNKKWSTIRSELDKCDLLCSNCHREAHYDPEVYYQARAWYKAYKERSRMRAVSNKEKICKHCGDSFVPTTNESVVYCSRKCVHAGLEVVDWPDNLPELVKASSKRAVAFDLGVSDKAVAKRLRNHHRH